MWQKGQTGNPSGRRAEKPFSDALRRSIAAAGGDDKALRAIADNLLRMAQYKKGMVALPAIMAIADRLDGKPAQESVVSVTKRDASDWTREELEQFLREGSKVIEVIPNDAASELPRSPTKRLLGQS